MCDLVEAAACGTDTDRINLILEAVAESIRRASAFPDARVGVGDALDECGLGRLRLLGVLIELEDKFLIELPVDAVDRFRHVGDIACYIRSHEMAPDDDAPDEQTAAPTSSGRHAPEWLRWACARVFANPFRSARLAA
jgi:hypothetical protein